MRLPSTRMIRIVACRGNPPVPRTARMASSMPADQPAAQSQEFENSSRAIASSASEALPSTAHSSPVMEPRQSGYSAVGPDPQHRISVQQKADLATPAASSNLCTDQAHESAEVLQSLGVLKDADGLHPTAADAVQRPASPSVQAHSIDVEQAPASTASADPEQAIEAVGPDKPPIAAAQQAPVIWTDPQAEAMLAGMSSVPSYARPQAAHAQSANPGALDPPEPAAGSEEAVRSDGPVGLHPEQQARQSRPAAFAKAAPHMAASPERAAGRQRPATAGPSSPPR